VVVAAVVVAAVVVVLTMASCYLRFPTAVYNQRRWAAMLLPGKDMETRDK
jgi:hypothetical protein